MPAAPLFLAGEPVLAYTRIDERHRPTGNCRHIVQGMSAGPAEGLAICRASGGGVYLFGCDAEWNVVTDTWHEALEDAQHQAEFEYKGVSETWRSH